MPVLMRDEAWRMAREWCDAWNRGDLDAVMAHYADEVELNSPTAVKRWGVADGWLRGKDKVRANFAIGIRTPGLRFDLVEVLLGVNAMCVIYRRETGALVCDAVEVDDDGRARRVVACYGEPREAGRTG